MTGPVFEFFAGLWATVELLLGVRGGCRFEKLCAGETGPWDHGAVGVSRVRAVQQAHLGICRA
jgi:hypothetical protein